jgi:hypothetical protein
MSAAEQEARLPEQMERANRAADTGIERSQDRVTWLAAGIVKLNRLPTPTVLSA